MTGSEEATEAASAARAGGAPTARPNPGRLVALNVLMLVASQLVTTPVSMIVNAVLARTLGAGDFGAIYLATTALTVAFLVVDWGGQGMVAAEVARDRATAAEIFGTALVQRLAIGSVVLLLAGPFAKMMGYGATVQMVLFLIAIRMAIASFGNLCSAILRGFEEIGWYARAAVLGNLLEAAVLIPTLLLGGRLRAALIVQIITTAITVSVQVALLMRLRIGRPRVKSAALRLLFQTGLGFLVLDLVIRLQAYIDAGFLAKLSTPESMGWYSAANRIVGVLLFPATTIAFALYPTVARLWFSDRAAYGATVRVALRTVAVLGIFAATGTMLFAGVAVRLVYGEERFGPATADLRVLAAYVLLVYASIVLGTGIVAARRQLAWAVAQSLCLVISLLLDPVLIPIYQARSNNGGLGVSISVVIAEVAMFTSGLLILPRGVLDMKLLVTALRALASGAAMAAAGALLLPHSWLAIPASVAAYWGALWLLGGFDAEVVEFVRDLARKKVAGQKPAPPA